MVSSPVVESRKEQPYLAIHRKVNMKDIPFVLPPLIGEVKQWIEQHNIATDCTPFFLYKSMNGNNELEATAGILVNAPATGNEHIKPGSFPQGKYATLIYTGDYNNLIEGHMTLEAYVKQNGLNEKEKKSGDVVEWGGRTEFYLTDPALEPDPLKWKTEIAFLLEE
ncbi:MAG: transcriptional activator ligand binding domain protein [Ferruginibacter sp.]|nr:transcriptional activator ligand binding domain protein [Ferruginibacter sp.]